MLRDHEPTRAISRADSAVGSPMRSMPAMRPALVIVKPNATRTLPFTVQAAPGSSPTMARTAPPQVQHVGNVRAAQPQPGFLHRVLGVGARAQDAVRDVAQVRAVCLELGGQRIGGGHLAPFT